jgi:hypothetical protein
MTETTQQNALRADLTKVLDRYRDEFDMSLDSVVGVVTVIQHCLVMEAYEVVCMDDLEDEP